MHGYTDRAFDFVNNTMTNSCDPTLGVQRFFWSKNFKPGVPFSNTTHYSNPKPDEPDRKGYSIPWRWPQ